MRIRHGTGGRGGTLAACDCNNGGGNVGRSTLKAVCGRWTSDPFAEPEKLGRGDDSGDGPGDVRGQPFVVVVRGVWGK